MAWTFVMVLGMSAMATASTTLKICNAGKNGPVTCVNNTDNGNKYFLRASINGVYTIHHYNISTIEDGHAMPEACIDLSFNEISNISLSLPPAITYLNLSHNMLQQNWLQTSLNLTTLDISYNQGGLPWFENISWIDSLPNLTRLVFRGNNLTRLRLYDFNKPKLPPSLYALDLRDNPNLIVMTDNRSFTYISKHVTVTADPNSYNDVLRACENRSNYVLSLPTYPINYSPQGYAQFDKTVMTSQVFYVCAFYDIDRSITSPPPGFVYVQYKSSPSLFWPIIVGMVAVVLIMSVVYCIVRCSTRRRQDLAARNTLSSSNCSHHDLVGHEIYRVLPVDDIGDSHVFRAMSVSTTAN
ncbi:hypothetical protein LEN26_017580 [Aphanomyces euteiches]|nr:hypothetical protein LEN26_017580 [Aphanomyces euteiches]KAH9123247.1 hypothetical protein AeMF1_005718 [Aphanomyces euteiches]KAH9182848.1 hypothetical protein AeNC1_015177 [Aphanomyces euteiches]